MTGNQFEIAVGRLRAACKRWGGVLVHSKGAIDPEFVAPFTDLVGCNWDTWTVMYRRPSHWQRYAFAIAAIVHEMGHVFASKKPPGDQVDESAFLGWELAVSSKAGLSIDQWQTAQESYMLNDDRFDLLDSVALVKSLAPLLELPYVSGTGEPLAIRPRPRIRKRRPRAPSAQLTLF